MLFFWRRGGSAGKSKTITPVKELPWLKHKVILGSVGLAELRRECQTKNSVLEYSDLGEGVGEKDKNFSRRKTHRGRDGDGMRGRDSRLKGFERPSFVEWLLWVKQCLCVILFTSSKATMRRELLPSYSMGEEVEAQRVLCQEVGELRME